jgi:DNA (cytosine-5)-methyltransferase 1
VDRRTKKPKLLDLCCCAGGAGMGYWRAGFEVVGIDKDPQPNYPFEFHQADALEFLYESHHLFDAVHVSPPCQANSALTKGNRARGWVDTHVDLIPQMRKLLDLVGLPYVIENVQGSSLRRDLTLCGEQFGLAVIRHRYFELGKWAMNQIPHTKHRGRVSGWRHGALFEGPYFAVYGDGGGKGSVQQWQDAMGIHWTDVRRELSEAIPPAYTEYVGMGLRNHLARLKEGDDA